jgi:hypothetical protein
MDKINKFYAKLDLKRDILKYTLGIEMVYSAIIFIMKYLMKINVSASMSMYNLSILIMILSIIAIVGMKNSDGLPEGMEMADILSYYPIDINKMYIHFMKRIMLFSLVHTAISVVCVAFIGGKISDIIAMILVDIMTTMYMMMSYWIAYGRQIKFEKELKHSVDTGIGVAIILSPIYILLYVIVMGNIH